MRPHGLQPDRLLSPWDSPGKNTGMGCHFLLQGVFQTQNSNPYLMSPALASRCFTTGATWEHNKSLSPLVRGLLHNRKIKLLKSIFQLMSLVKSQTSSLIEFHAFPGMKPEYLFNHMNDVLLWFPKQLYFLVQTI